MSYGKFHSNCLGNYGRIMRTGAGFEKIDRTHGLTIPSSFNPVQHWSSSGGLNTNSMGAY